MILRPRSYFGWGPTGADYARPRSGLVIHYNGPATNLGDHSECIAYWKRVRRDHMNKGWADLGYSWGACRHGEIFEGRGLNRYQAAQGTTSGNSNYYSVSLMLGGTEQPTQAQIQAVRDLRAYLMARGNSGTIKGHRNFVSTSCPGNVLYAMVQDGTFGQAGDGSVGGGTEYRAEDGDGLLEPYEYGPAIEDLQTALNTHGHNLDVDGYYGPGTTSAVRDYQQANGLDVDGIAGPQTLGHLGLPTDPAPAANSGIPTWPGVYLRDYTHHSSVTTWQQRMKDRGWYIAVDGHYGPGSAHICRQFQAEKGLDVDGVVGPDTWSASWTAPVT